MARTATFGVVCILFIILFHSFETTAARKLARNLLDHSGTHVNVSGNGGDYRRSLASVGGQRPRVNVRSPPPVGLRRPPVRVPRPPPPPPRPPWRVPAPRSPPGQHP